MATIHEGQGGWYLDIDTFDTDLATATDPKIWYTKPSGGTSFWTASITGTKLRKVFVDSDFPAGETMRNWVVQGTYVIATGRTRKTPKRELKIWDALDE